jgi:hypothetical protein
MVIYSPAVKQKRFNDRLNLAGSATPSTRETSSGIGESSGAKSTGRALKAGM